MELKWLYMFKISGNKAIIITKGDIENNDQIFMYNHNTFLPINNNKVSKEIQSSKVSKKLLINHQNHSVKCKVLYKQYTTIKNSCTKSIFIPLQKVISESNKIWSAISSGNFYDKLKACKEKS